MIFFQTKFFSFYRWTTCYTRPGYSTTETQTQTCSRDPLQGFFQIKTLRKPFLLSLVDTHPPDFQYNWEGCWHIGMWPRQNTAHTWTPGAYYKGHYLGPVYIIKTEYLRVFSASRVWPYMHHLRIMSLVKCWVCTAPVFCCLTFRSIG